MTDEMAFAAARVTGVVGGESAGRLRVRLSIVGRFAR
jgi:hypothetical protein